MKIIIVPDDGREYVLVPEVAPDRIIRRIRDACPSFVMQETAMRIYAWALSAAPPCKVVELPGKELAFSVWASEWVDGWNACLDEIERRAK